MKFAARLKFASTGTNAANLAAGAAAPGCRTLAQCISDGDLAVSDAGIAFTIEDGAGNWETSLFTITSSTQITRTSVLRSSAGGTTPAVFAGSALVVFNDVPASHLSKTVTASVDSSGGVAGLVGPDGKVIGQAVSADVVVSFNVALDHANQMIPISSASAVNATIQPDATLNLPVGFNLALVRKGSGAVAFVAGSGVTIRTTSSLSARIQYSTIGIVKIAANEWVVAGDLA